MNGMVTTVIELTDDLDHALDEVAARTDRSRDEVIQAALHRYVAERRPEPDGDKSWPISIGIIDDPDLPNAAELDDWLKMNWRPEDAWGRTR